MHNNFNMRTLKLFIKILKVCNSSLAIIAPIYVRQNVPKSPSARANQMLIALWLMDMYCWLTQYNTSLSELCCAGTQFIVSHLSISSSFSFQIKFLNLYFITLIALKIKS